MRLATPLAGALTLLLLGACGGGSRRVAPAGNLAIQAPSLSISGPVAAGGELTVTLDVHSETPKFNVALTFDVVPLGGPIAGPGDVDPSDPGYEDLAFAVGGVLVDLLAGTTALTFPVEIPEDLPPGTYVLVFHVNRHDATPDDDHLQQEDPEDLADNTLVADVLLTVLAPTHPNLRVEACVPAEPVVDWLHVVRRLVPAGAAGNPIEMDAIPVALAAEVSAQHLDVPPGTRLRVELVNPFTDEWIPAWLGVSGAPDTYVPEVILPELRVGTSAGDDDPVEEDTRPTNLLGLGLEVIVPEALLVEPILDGDFTLRLRCVIDPDHAVLELGETPPAFQADNVCEFEVVFLAPDAPPEPKPGPPAAPVSLVVPGDLRAWLWNGTQPQPLPYRDGASAVLEDARRTAGYSGKSDYGAGYAFGVSNSCQNAAQTFTKGPAPRSTFFSAYGNVYADLWGKRFVLVDGRGGVLNDSCIPILRRGFEVRVLGATLWSSYSGGASTITFQHAWSREKSASRTFLVGPVPVTLEAGLEGTLGFRATLSAAPGAVLSASAGPRATLTGFARASINLVVASGGVTAEVEFIELTVTAHATLTVPCPDQGGPQLTFSVPWSLRTLDGRIYLWVKYPAPTWKNPGKKKTKTWTLVDWKGFELASGSLWNFTRTW